MLKQPLILIMVLHQRVVRSLINCVKAWLVVSCVSDGVLNTMFIWKCIISSRFFLHSISAVRFQIYEMHNKNSNAKHEDNQALLYFLRGEKKQEGMKAGPDMLLCGKLLFLFVQPDWITKIKWVAKYLIMIIPNSDFKDIIFCPSLTVDNPLFNFSTFIDKSG